MLPRVRTCETGDQIKMKNKYQPLGALIILFHCIQMFYMAIQLAQKQFRVVTYGKKIKQRAPNKT